MIDKNPRVGRYVVAESILQNGYFGKYRIITAIKGNRIYYSNQNTENYFIKFAAICDTIEEVFKLQDFSKKCIAEHNKLSEIHKEEQRDLFTKYDE